MLNKELLAKCVSLLYRESLLESKSENSSDLVRTVLENIKPSDVSLGISSDRDVLTALKSTILEMCDYPLDHVYEVSDLLQQLRINTGNDDKFFEALKQGIVEEMSESGLKRSIVNIRKSINNHFKEQTLLEVMTKYSSMLKYNRDKIPNINQFITEVVGQLEPLQMSNSSKDPALIGEIDLGDDDGLHKLFHDIKTNTNGGAVYKTGWGDLDDMLQGGFRPGLSCIPALQHKYKTGFSLSIFKGIALCNKPQTTPENKKPLLLRISFEDNLEDNLQFLYQSLKYDETRQPVKIDNQGLTVEEISAYIKDRLQVNGFHIKMLRVDPTQWSYKSICNKIIELEAQGYNIEVLMLDYLGLVPTTGCLAMAGVGSDLRDMFRRIRNFVLPKKITCITPHQLSTEAKQLTRNGVPEDKFVCEVSEKGYYAGSKQLDQELDLEVYIHIFKFNKEWYLSVQRGKHRIPTIVADMYKYFILKFPTNGMPIPMDRDGEKQGFRRLNQAPTNAPDELFELN